MTGILRGKAMVLALACLLAKIAPSWPGVQAAGADTERKDDRKSLSQRPGSAGGQAESEPTYGGKPLSRLIDELKGANHPQRLNALAALSKLGPEAIPAIPAVSEALHDPHPGVRVRAAGVLAKVGSEAVPALTQALDSKDERIGLVAAHALGDLGPAAQTAVPRLRVALGDADATVRVDAAFAPVATYAGCEGRAGPTGGPESSGRSGAPARRVLLG